MMSSGFVENITVLGASSSDVIDDLNLEIDQINHDLRKINKYTCTHNFISILPNPNAFLLRTSKMLNELYF